VHVSYLRNHIPNDYLDLTSSISASRHCGYISLTSKDRTYLSTFSSRVIQNTISINSRTGKSKGTYRVVGTPRRGLQRNDICRKDLRACWNSSVQTREAINSTVVVSVSRVECTSRTSKRKFDYELINLGRVSRHTPLTTTLTLIRTITDQK